MSKKEKEKETECEGCMMFENKWCNMHYIEVNYNDEGCRDYIDKSHGTAKTKEGGDGVDRV